MNTFGDYSECEDAARSIHVNATKFASPDRSSLPPSAGAHHPGETPIGLLSPSLDEIDAAFTRLEVLDAVEEPV